MLQEHALHAGLSRSCRQAQALNCREKGDTKHVNAVNAVIQSDSSYDFQEVNDGLDVDQDDNSELE